MSDAKLVNIARLMTTYNFEIEQLPDNLRCAQCKFVLKDACQVPCGCRICRACIVDKMLKGSEFCPGDSEECGESLLSLFVSHYEVNSKISKLAVKCPHYGCMHMCQLANMEEHLRECPRKNEECPFCELGCTQDKLAAKEMDGHLKTESRRHSEILIGLIANINKAVEILKQKDEASNREIQRLKHELVLKDEQIRSINDQMIHLQNENTSIKNDIKSIKEENDDLAGRVRILSEEMQQEITERCENDELDKAKVIEHVDREIVAVTELIGSNKDEFSTKMQSVKDDIISINQNAQWIKDNFCSVKSQVESIQDRMGLGQIDARFAWLINVNVHKTSWYLGNSQSEYFTGAVHPYKYRLKSANYDVTDRATLCIQLYVYAGPNDERLQWPFEARVVITVTDRDRREASKKISRQCRIEKPSENDYNCSYPFEFTHSDLIKTGVKLARGVRVSCVIIPDAC